MGWYFLSQYEDFYRPGDPYGIVKWYVSGVFTIILSLRVRLPIQVNVKDRLLKLVTYIFRCWQENFYRTCKKENHHAFNP